MTVKNNAVAGAVKTSHKEPLFHLVKRTDIATWKKWLIRVVAVVIALLIAGIVCAALTGGKNFVKFYSELFSGSLGTVWRLQVMLQAWAILMCISLAVTPAFKMRFWNIGAEGQTLISALAAVVCIMYFGGKIPEPALILTMLAFSVVAGAIWAVIPAIFKAFWGTNETLFTLMMNYVATQLVLYAVNIWAKDGSGTLGVLSHGSFDKLFGMEYIQNVVFVTLLTVIVFVYLKFFKHGYELEVVGESVNTAKYIGINVKKVIIRTMVFSGVMCGLAGFLLVGGSPSPTVNANLVGGRGFTAILVSWLSKFSPIAMIFVTLLVVFLERGATQAANTMRLGDSGAFVDIVVGLFFLLIIACEFFLNYKIKFRKKEGK